MNAKQAKLLMLHEVVMWDHNSQETGTVCQLDPINKRVFISWKGNPQIWHKYDDMKLIQRWQPTEDQIMEETMQAQLEDDQKEDERKRHKQEGEV
jgi:hypothetical protein